MTSFVVPAIVTCSFLLGIFVTVGEAAAGIEIVTPLPGKPNECPLRDGSTLPVGKTAPIPDQCAQRTCSKSGDKLMLDYASCGAIDPPPGCSLVEDKTKPYPDCCPKSKCS
uniref:SLPTX16 n=1 Tax=Scolopendra viridis TaxID=118503 RepID=A0A4D5RA38_SCOVI